jgi:hypothetical protein
MTNKITSEERGRIIARAKELISDPYGDNTAIVDMLISEFAISRNRAHSATTKAIRLMRGETRRSRAGTPPNTSLVLSDDELAFISQHYGGEKSRAIHDGLKLLRKQV